MSTAPDSTLANPERLISDLRRQLGDLQGELAASNAERDAALAREDATAEVLQVINSSPGDLAPVFGAILEKAHSLCGADYGALLNYDGERFRPIAGHGGSARFADTIGPDGFPPPPGGALWELTRGAPFAQIVDMAETAAQRPDDPMLHALVAIGGIRTQLVVSLRKDEALLGAITANRQEVRPFSEKQIALLQNFAAQAVIAMENARLLTETREALEQQTATAEVLKVINASPGDLAPVFGAMLEKATRLCEAQMGALWTYDGENMCAEVVHGAPPQYAEFLKQGPHPPRTGQQRLIDGARIVHVADITESEAYHSGDPLSRTAGDFGGIRTLLVVPLRKDGAFLGTIGVYRQEVRPFSDKQIGLLENFAAQAVIAMENARLLTETREALEQQTATAEVLQVINSSPGDLAPVFGAILEKAHTLCGAEYGGLATYDGEYFRLVAGRGYPEHMVEVLRRPFRGNFSHQQLLHGERYVHIPDILAIPELTDLAGRAFQEEGFRTILMVPLRKDDILLGQIVAARREVRPFSETEIALVENFAAQAVIAMENARLITETREALEQQTATAEVLQIINSSPGDLAPVFDAMLNKALRLCDAAFGILLTFDGDTLRTVGFRNVPEALAEYMSGGPLLPDPNTTLGRVVRERRTIHTTDNSEAEPYRNRAPLAVAAVELGNARTVLHVPLIRENTVLGVFIIFRQEVRLFSDKQIALLENFAAQAVIAMENARLITETREALEQQTATAEVLGVINNSPGDLTPVFEAILERAHTLCGAAFGGLAIFDGQQFRFVAGHGESDIAQYSIQPRPDGGAPLERVMRGEKLVHLADARTDESYSDGTEFRSAIDLFAIRTLLVVPLRNDVALLGAITAYRQEVKPFSDKEIALLQNFAAQAVIAMENARLITELRQRTGDLQESLEYQTATSDVLKVIGRSGTELDSVLQTLAETAARICEADTAAIIRMRDGQLWLAASLGFSTEWRELFERRPLEPNRASATGRAVQERRAIHIEDVTTDPEYGWPDSQQLGKYRTTLAVPLLRDDAAVGVITLGRVRVEAFTDKQIALVTTFAAQAVIAMENARLLGELRGRTEEIAGWNRGLEARVAEQVEELGRVGRLKRFLAPQLAELIVSQGDEKILESHRREIVVVFCDLRGYTAFTETAEPEEVLDFLRQYHGALGPLVSQFEGTLDQFSGDGIMVFFNDPIPCPDPAERAVKMAMAMREAAGKLIADWRRHGCDLGFGAGIAQGYATLGQIGFSERSGYTAIGTVCNLAARLCAEAKDGQILVSSRIAEAVAAVATIEDLGNLELKGLRRPVAAFNVTEPVSGTSAAL
jgi:GAF domain-containing protein